MTTIGIRELREDMRTIIGRVIDGDSFTLTDYRHPVAILVPVAHNARYSITNAHGLTALYCTPCGAIIGNVCGPVPDLLATIGTHDTTHHTEEHTVDPDDIPTSITRETYTITRSLIADGLPVLSQNQTAMLLAHFWPAIEQHVRGQVANEIVANLAAQHDDRATDDRYRPGLRKAMRNIHRAASITGEQSPALPA